jgi:hypothetical protein
VTTPAFHTATELHALLHAVPFNAEHARDTMEALLLLVAADAHTIGKLQSDLAQHRAFRASLGAYVASGLKLSPSSGVPAHDATPPEASSGASLGGDAVAPVIPIHAREAVHHDFDGLPVENVDRVLGAPELSRHERGKPTPQPFAAVEPEGAE